MIWRLHREERNDLMHSEAYVWIAQLNKSNILNRSTVLLCLQGGQRLLRNSRAWALNFMMHIETYLYITRFTKSEIIDAYLPWYFFAMHLPSVCL